MVNVGVLLTHAPYTENTAVVDRYDFKSDVENEGEEQNPEYRRYFHS
jgi:hypothetical protein